MNLLIDTHAVIWFITKDSKLPIKTRKLIEDAKNNCFVSLASFWEMSIKNSLGRLDLMRPISEIFSIIENSGFEILPIGLPHILKNTTLDFHHYDPFDRIIIAQAIVEDMQLVTKDEKFSHYNIALVWPK